AGRAARGLIARLDAGVDRRPGLLPAAARRVELIDRNAGTDVGSLRLLRVRLRQEHRARSEMVAADLAGGEWLGVLHVAIADDDQVVAGRLGRGQAGRGRPGSGARSGRGAR